jgi:hypothetical protein
VLCSWYGWTKFSEFPVSSYLSERIGNGGPVQSVNVIPGPTRLTDLDNPFEGTWNVDSAPFAELITKFR